MIECIFFLFLLRCYCFCYHKYEYWRKFENVAVNKLLFRIIIIFIAVLETLSILKNFSNIFFKIFSKLGRKMYSTSMLLLNNLICDLNEKMA